MIGSPVQYVEGRVQTKFFDFDVDDVALLLLEHKNENTKMERFQL